MTELKPGDRVTCKACGREFIVGEDGTSPTTIWCCGQPMEKIGEEQGNKEKSSPGGEAAAPSG